MEEELIKFDTTKLAKELGFKEGCRYVVNEDKEYNSSFEYTGEQTFTLEESIEASNNTNKEHFLAPTQSLLQKWLREKHNLHIEVKVLDYIENPKYYTSIFGSYKESKMIRCLWNSLKEDYTTYELALEDALIKALNIIKDEQTTKTTGNKEIK